MVVVHMCTPGAVLLGIDAKVISAHCLPCWRTQQPLNRGPLPFHWPPTALYLTTHAGEMVEKVGEAFKEDGSVGRQFTPEGSAGEGAKGQKGRLGGLGAG
jgi:hypothetical protein